VVGESILNNELIQFGFAGFGLLQLGVIVWLIKQLISVLTKNNSIIAKHTDVMGKLDEHIQVGNQETRGLSDLLKTRPCIRHRSND